MNNKVKKVLILNNGYPSSKEPNNYIFVHRQALALKKAGIEVCVLSIDLRSVRWIRKYGIYKDNYQGIQVIRVSFPFITGRLVHMNIKLNRIFALIGYKKIRRDIGDFNIIHSHFSYASGHAGLALKEKYGMPLVITEHSSLILRKDSRIIKSSLEVYRKADCVIVVSTALQHCLSELGYADARVIPNIIETNRFKPEQRKKGVFFRFVSVGSLSDGKRFDILLKAFEEVQRVQGENIGLTIIGEGRLRKTLEMQVIDNQIKNVEFVGEVPNDKMPDWYNDFNCFILASDYETFGVVIAEAISCGLPVVVTDSGGSKDIVTEENGLVVPCGNVKALAKAMRTIITTYKNYDSETMHHYIEQTFGTQRIINCITEVYKEVI